MPTPDWDDLDAFVDTDDFAVLCTVTPQEGPPRQIKGIFDEPYFNAQIGEYETDSSRPRLHCKEADVAGLKREDSVNVPSEGNFTIMGYPQRDGTGMAVLELARDVAP